MGKAQYILAAAYLLIAVVTFGHSADSFERHQRCPNQVADCYAPGAVVTGLFSGAMWPLYWSWELWSWAR